MPLDDLEMMANPPRTDPPARADRAPDVSPEAEEAHDADLGKAAAAETMPAPKEKCEDCEETRAERIARRGQDPPDPGVA
jgi:hypothetical protein